jgi:hypothetical protein
LKEELAAETKAKEASQKELRFVELDAEEGRRGAERDIAQLKRALETADLTAQQELAGERSRAQQAIDFIKSKLKGQIRELKIELETNRTSGTDGRSDKRKLEKDLAKAKEQIEEETRDRARDARQLDSLKKQVEMLKDRVDKVRC